MPTGNIIKTDPEKRYRKVLSASTLEGDTVRNMADEDLGKISDIMIDIPSGRVAYAVLSFGGVLGIGSKLFAIPWSVLKVDEDEKRFILDMDKATLENAPGFDNDNWPDMSDTTWGSQIYEYYHAKPYWENDDRLDRNIDRNMDRTMDRDLDRNTDVNRRTRSGGGGL